MNHVKVRCLKIVLEISRNIDEVRQGLRLLYEDVDWMIVNVTISNHVIGV
mgnify:FL=1